MRSDTRLAYQPALDGLRAFAVAAVIAYHLRAHWAQGGFLGVDAFFVLSGYLITSLLLAEWRRRASVNLPGFWARRARRLLPALLLVLAAIAAYAASFAPAYQLRSLRLDGLASLFYAANWRFVASGQSYFDQFSVPSPLRHLWSLAIEEQFYLLWPLIVVGCLRAFRGSRRALATVCVTGGAVSVALMAGVFDRSDPSRAYYGTDSRAHTLLVGALLAVVLAGRPPRALVTRGAIHAAGLAGVVAMFWAFVRVGDQTSGLYHGGSLLFAFAVAALIASAVQPDRTPIRAALSLRPLRWIGQISYGLYLWHWPAIVVLTPDRTHLDGAPLTVARVAVTLGASTLSYYLVEQPIRRGALRRWRARVAVPAAFATAGVALVVATAGAVPASPLERVRTGDVLTVHSQATTVAAERSGFGASPERMVLVGDSVPYTLLPGLEPAAAKRGVALDAVLVPGCGVLSGVATYTDGNVPPDARECDRIVPPAERAGIDRLRPDLIVWMSTWETNDRIVAGKRIEFGDRAWDEMTLGKVDEAADRLSASGAHVVLVLMPPRAVNGYSGDLPTEDARYVRLAELYREYARTHPGKVSTVDFSAALCPGGPPCPPTVDGIAPRPLDGLHFTPQTAGWGADRLLDLLLACRRTSTGWLCPDDERSKDAASPSGSTKHRK